METLIVGGNFSESPKSSKVVSLLGEHLRSARIINGGPLENLPQELTEDLVIWMPNIENEQSKHYPVKKKGSVLICSKVMRSGYKEVEAVSRIFRMHGNAVIAIWTDSKPFTFKLIDALGNTWYTGGNLEELSTVIKEFYDWTKRAVRICSVRDDNLIPEKHENLGRLLEINNKFAGHIQESCGERFFGNLSTRCQKLFPSLKGFGIYVSPRNSDKSKLSPEDMVYMKNNMSYHGPSKPSVDSPCQIAIYNHCPQIHYMIHGHAFIQDAPTTKTYYLCGDVNEASEVIGLIGSKTCGHLNLKNHGFLVYSGTIEELEDEVNNLLGKFDYARN